MQVFETNPINFIIWTTMRLNGVNGWSIVDDKANGRYLAVQAKAVAIFPYTLATKSAMLQAVNAFAERNTFVKLLAPEIDTRFYATEELFIYSRQYFGSGIAYGAVAKRAARKVIAGDTEWLARLIESIDEQTGSIQLNDHDAFLSASCFAQAA